MRPRAALRLLATLHGVGLAVSPLYELLSLQECEQLQKMYGGQIDERTLEKTQQQHMLYQQEQHHQILQQQIQVGLPSPLSPTCLEFARRLMGLSVLEEITQGRVELSYLCGCHVWVQVIKPFDERREHKSQSQIVSSLPENGSG